MQFNSIFANAYATGGDVASAASCTLNAVNYMSGMDIQNFMVVDFGGLVNMINDIGGVDVCIPTDMQDAYTGLNLTRGMQHLDGTTATQYARTRHATGTDGSDTMRTTRQQYLIKQIVKTALSKNYFTQTSQLYQLAKSALKSVQMSAGLADAGTLVGLATSLKNFDMTHLYSQTIPIEPWVQDNNRSQLADGDWSRRFDVRRHHFRWLHLRCRHRRDHPGGWHADRQGNQRHHRSGNRRDPQPGDRPVHRSGQPLHRGHLLRREVLSTHNFSISKPAYGLQNSINVHVLHRDVDSAPDLIRYVTYCGHQYAVHR